MKIVEITPIEKGVFKDSLTYFSKTDVAVGALVSIKIKNRNTLGLVLSVRPAEEAKTQIKNSNFSLKKIDKVLYKKIFNADFIEAIKTTATFFNTPIGAVLKTTIPKVILDELEVTKFKLNDSVVSTPAPLSTNLHGPDHFALQDSTAERIGFYRSLTREAFARKQSVLVCVPTAYEAEKLLSELSRGIEPYTKILHSKIPKEKIITSWQESLSTDHPELIITTPSFISIPKNFDTIIVEKENNDSYYPITRPFIDPRFILNSLAEIGQKKIIFGDISLRANTIYRVDKKELLPASPLKYRVMPNVPAEIVDMKTKATGDEKKTYNILSRELRVMLKTIHQTNRQAFFLTGRRGLSPITICNDCNTIVSCPKCGKPLVLHSDNVRTNIYICHHCGQSEKINDHCPNCDSWRLSPLGVGTEAVVQKITEENKDLPVFIVDSDHTNTQSKVIKVIEKFLNTPGSVLVGTELALRYLTKPLTYTSIISIDHLFSIPNFRQREKILYLLLNLKEITQTGMVIQTRFPEEEIFQYLVSGNLADFYRQELEDRRSLNYPPFSHLIKISRSGGALIIKKDIEKLSKLLEKYKPIVFESLTPTDDNLKKLNLVIKVGLDNWPNEELSQVLDLLPPSFVININPPDIL